jgi:GntR family transcriptional regulator
VPALARILGPLDPAQSLPLYQQLQRGVRKAIRKGALGVDDALPSERELAQVLSVSRITVRQAIKGLVEEGLLESRHGAGTFVRQRIEKNFAKLTSFSEDIASRGYAPRTVWIKRAQGIVNPEEALKLGVSPGTKVLRFHRLRLADDVPMAIEYATILAWALPSVQSVRDSLYEALSARGLRPVRALQRLRALLLTGEQARLLHAPVGDAGLMVERLGYLADGRALELTHSIYRGANYDFVAELTTLE